MPGDGTYRCLPQSRFRTLEKLQKQPPFKNSRAGLSPLGWPHPLGRCRRTWCLGPGRPQPHRRRPLPGPGGLPQLRGSHCLVPQVQRPAPRPPTQVCAWPGAALRAASELLAMPPSPSPVPPHSSVLTSVTPGDDDEPQASRATSTRPLCPNSDPKDHRAPSRSFPPCSSSLREDPQVLSEELAGPRAAGRPQRRPRRPCPAASWGAEPSPSFPDPRKE